MHYLDIFILQNLAYMFRPIMAIIRALEYQDFYKSSIYISLRVFLCDNVFGFKMYVCYG